MDWIDLAWDSDRWRALISRLINQLVGFYSRGEKCSQRGTD